MKLILLGPPGAGKGTQAEVLSKKLNIPAISTGNILRTAIKNETAVGREAKAYMSAGRLVPDDVIIAIVEERIQKADCADGFILDGMPRTIPQAEALDRAGIEFDFVISLEISDNEIVKRMAGRSVCGVCGTPYHITAKPPKRSQVCDVCGGTLIQRDDDDEAVVRRRLAVYHEETAPLKEYYREKGLLVRVASRPTPAEDTKALLDALGVLCKESV